jgi:uncharacterized membrane protein YphA (DoxX/SURF4 family)
VGTRLLWAAQIVAAAAFLMSGGMKLLSLGPAAEMFGIIGLGQWFRYLTGTIEVVSAVLLLVPGLAFFGAALLVPTMIGAIATHLFVIGGTPAPAIVLLAVTATIAWQRRPTW